MLGGHARSTLSPATSPALRRQALEEICAASRRARAPPASPTRSCSPAATRCAPRSTRPCSRPRGARRASGRSRHCSCAAPRGLGRREVLRDARAHLRSDPGRHIDLMELQYLCLALGFAGKYQVQDRGQERASRSAERDLTGASAPSARRRAAGAVAALEGRRGPAQPLIRYLPWWVVGRRLARRHRRHVRHLQVPARRPWRSRCTRRSPRSGTESFTAPRCGGAAYPGPTLQTAARGRGVPGRRDRSRRTATQHA